MTLEETSPYSEIFCYPTSFFPIRYLGVPLHHDKLRRQDIQPPIDKILKINAGWSENLISKGRLYLFKLV